MTTDVEAWMAACGLPARWRGRTQFVILLDRFGSGSDFLAIWRAWRADPQRCECLHVISTLPDLPDATALDAALPTPTADPESWRALRAAWPVPTPGLHRVTLEGGRVCLLIALGCNALGDNALSDNACRWGEFVAQVDAFWLHGADSLPTDLAARRFKRLARLAAVDATCVGHRDTEADRRGLVSAGFVLDRSASADPGGGDLPCARYAPPFTPRRVAPRSVAHTERRAVIVGAGLAGCAVAWALAEHGWQSLVLDRQQAPALEGSGNPAGLFHGIVNAHDGVHARFNRSAALEAQKAVQIAIDEDGVTGQVSGLLRLETSIGSESEMNATLARLRLPAGYVQVVGAARASVLCGMSVRHPGWFYPGGGWVHPGGLARSFLRRAGDRASFQGNVSVHRLERRGAQWALLDPDDRLIETAGTVVLANAADSIRLLGRPEWPIEVVRGQISMHALGDSRLEADPRQLARPDPVVKWPTMPLTGAGYLLPAVGGWAIFGATSQPGDPDAGVRREDHDFNLAQLSRLIGVDPRIDPRGLLGRTGWRQVCADKLPMIGAVPRSEHAGQPGWFGAGSTHSPRLDRPAGVPREAGLFVCTAFGSRGITWAALAGRILAAWVTGSPAPLYAKLIDAVDPARFVSRMARRLNNPNPRTAKTTPP